MTVSRLAVLRAAWVALSFTTFAPAVEAQNASKVPAAQCRGDMPALLVRTTRPAVVVRIMAVGEFPDSDVAAARALLLLTRDVIAERVPVALQPRLEVDRTIAASVDAVADVRGLAAGSQLLTASIQRAGDSVVVLWKLRTVGRAVPARDERIAVAIQDLTRGAIQLAGVATRAGAPSAPALGAAPSPMPSVEAGNVYVVALAEALSPTPSALSRARALLVRATTLAPSHADAWRWRARVEQMLIDWNTSGRTSEVRGLRASALASAARAVQLAPRSNGALVSLAEAYLGSNDGEKTVSLLLDVARREIDHPGMLRVASMYHRTIGNDTRAYDQIRTAVQHGPQSASLLVELASFARLRGDVTLACHALNAAVQADAELASAYALRALVRAGLGERREGWADAEIATRLGHPEWGERAAAVLDARFADRNNAVQRLGAMGGISATPVNYIAAVLLAEASLAVSVRGAAAKIVTGLACDSPLRPQLLRDLQGMGVVPADVCKPSTRPPARK